MDLLIDSCLYPCLVLFRSKVWFKVALVILPIFLNFPLFFFYLSDNSFLVFLLVLSLERLIKVLKFFLCLNATIKLFLFFLSHVLDSRDVLEESLSCLFTDITCNQMILVTHVHSMVVNSEWPLRSHELGYCCVVRMRNGFFQSGDKTQRLLLYAQR